MLSYSHMTIWANQSWLALGLDLDGLWSRQFGMVLGKPSKKKPKKFWQMSKNSRGGGLEQVHVKKNHSLKIIFLRLPLVIK